MPSRWAARPARRCAASPCACRRRAGPRDPPRDRPRGSSTLPTSSDLYDELQRIYRAAFERLEAQGRIEEAAFLLAEVLQRTRRPWPSWSATAACASPPRWPRRASCRPAWWSASGSWPATGGAPCWIARRTGAFADAVDPPGAQPPARGGRRPCACSGGTDLAEAGDYAAAVEVVWPVHEARRLRARMDGPRHRAGRRTRRPHARAQGRPGARRSSRRSATRP